MCVYKLYKCFCRPEIPAKEPGQLAATGQCEWMSVKFPSISLPPVVADVVSDWLTAGWQLNGHIERAREQWLFVRLAQLVSLYLLLPPAKDWIIKLVPSLICWPVTCRLYPKISIAPKIVIFLILLYWCDEIFNQSFWHYGAVFVWPIWAFASWSCPLPPTDFSTIKTTFKTEKFSALVRWPTSF